MGSVIALAAPQDPSQVLLGDNQVPGWRCSGLTKKFIPILARLLNLFVQFCLGDVAKSSPLASSPDQVEKLDDVSPALSAEKGAKEDRVFAIFIENN
jgi:hypothetical protein